MAEGGQKSGENPFSFQNFVKKKSNPKQNQDQNGSFEDSEDDLPDDIFEPAELPRAKSAKKVENKPVIFDGEFDPERPQKKKDPKSKKKTEENPFSFKKFLKKEPTPPAGRPTYTNGGASGPAPDFTNDLPDFVQDHFSTDLPRSRSSSGHSHVARSRTQSEVSLPDFALCSASPKESSLFPSINAVGNLLHRDDGTRMASSSLSNGGHGGLDNEPVTVSPRHAGLPDFLSDSVGLSADINGASNVMRREVSPLIGTEDLSGEVKRLQDENRSLRQQLQESREFAERESRRVTKVLSEMQALQKRESEETAALENMVQQVEANLKITTARAVKAENTITKLKQEIKGLQGQVASLTAENHAIQSGDTYLEEMRDKTQCIAQQLSSAAQNADQSLRQLLSGVTNLHLMSDILLNIGKITEQEEPPGAEPEASNTPPPQNKSTSAATQNKTPSSPGQRKTKTSASPTSSGTPPTQRKNQGSSPNKSKTTKPSDSSQT